METRRNLSAPALSGPGDPRSGQTVQLLQRFLRAGGRNAATATQAGRQLYRTQQSMLEPGIGTPVCR